MKYISIFVFLFLCLYFSINTNADLVGLWLFDEGNGDVAEDSSGNGNNGKINFAKYVNGKYGKALDFNGTNANVEIQHKDVLSVEEFTLMAWINVPKFTGAWQTIATQNTDGPIRNYGLFINDGSGLIHYSFTSGKAWQSFNAKSNVVNGEWRHIAATYDRKIFICYVDGIVDGQTVNNLKPDNAQTVITIGSWVGGGWLKGMIDEVALYNKALSEKEINNAMKGLKGGGKAVEKGGKTTSCWAKIKSY
jgi:hypothetical protein